MPFDGTGAAKVGRRRWRGQVGAAEACSIGEALTGFVDALGPAPREFDTVGEALAELLPAGLRAHCRVGSLSGGCLKLEADGSSYVYELQLCRAGLLEELRRTCPAARLRRIEVGMAR